MKPVTTTVANASRIALLLFAFAVPAALMAAAPEGTSSASLHRIDPPATGDAGSIAVNVVGDSVLLSWLEAVEDGGHRLLFSEFDGETWSEARVIVSGRDFVANWADVPGITEDDQGTRYAHWLRTLGDDSHAYGVEIARSRDGGSSWERLGLLHDDESPTEHGFVSHSVVDGDVRSFWLDGRAMIGGGDTQVRTTEVGSMSPGSSAPPKSQVLDDRVCECCATDSAVTSDGPLIVYRDRSPEEIRDIALVHSTKQGWSEPVSVHRDGWFIEGCPVNGPAVAADGQAVVVAWFTAAKGKARVLAAWSGDGGRSFAEPVVIDDDRPRGQVDVVLDDGVALVSWLARAEGGTEARLRSVTVDGRIGPAFRAAPSEGERLVGLPVLARVGERALFVWGEGSEPSLLRAALMPLALEKQDGDGGSP